MLVDIFDDLKISRYLVAGEQCCIKLDSLSTVGFIVAVLIYGLGAKCNWPSVTYVSSAVVVVSQGCPAVIRGL